MPLVPRNFPPHQNLSARSSCDPGDQAGSVPGDMCAEGTSAPIGLHVAPLGARAETDPSVHDPGSQQDGRKQLTMEAEICHVVNPRIFNIIGTFWSTPCGGSTLQVPTTRRLP